MEVRVASSGRVSLFGSGFLSELRALLYTSGIERGAFYRGVAERNFRAYGAAYGYVGRHHVAGLPETKPVQAGR